jgi:two-component sensor histidine kinase
LAAVRAEKAILLCEIQHRVKNNLQVISSLLNLQANQGSDETIRAAFAASQARVQSIALAHEKLSQSPDLSRIDFCAYARELCEQLILAQEGEQPNITCSVRVSALRLSLDVCIICGLVVNELVTNSLKHAFQGRARGEISIALIRRGDLLELSVSDDGVGLPQHVEFGKAESLGLDLVAIFAKRLKANVFVTRQPGASLTLRFKEM